MADIIKAIDGVPQKLVDNNDGSYSLAISGSGGGSGGDASLAEQQVQTGILSNLDLLLQGASTLQEQQLQTSALETIQNSIESFNKTSLVLVYDDIVNAPAPANSATTWNSAFDTDAITNAIVVGNTITLAANKPFRIDGTIWYSDNYILEVLDYSGYIYEIQSALYNCTNLKTVVLNGLINALTNAISNNESLKLIYCPKLESANVYALNQNYSVASSTGYVFHYLPNLKHSERGLYSVATSDLSNPGCISFPSLKYADWLLGLCFANYPLVIDLPELEHCGSDCFSITGSGIKSLNTPKLKTTGAYFLYGSVQNGTVLHLESLESVGTQSFANNSGKTVTVYITEQFKQTSNEYKTFKSLNTVTEILVNKEHRLLYENTTADLTDSQNSQVVGDVDGLGNFTLALTLTTVGTPPTLQLQVSLDGLNYMQIGPDLVGEAGKTVSITVNGIHPKLLLWTTTTGGTSVGAGYKIVITGEEDV